MNVLIGIDPGPTESAFLILDNGNIVEFGKVLNEDLLCKVRALRGTATTVAIEGFQSFGMPVGKEVFETAYLIGRIIEALHCNNVHWRIVFRKDVCLHHCHSARAKDANVRQAMLDRFGPQGVKKKPGQTYGISGDVWSALAIASYAMDTAVKE